MDSKREGRGGVKQTKHEGRKKLKEEGVGWIIPTLKLTSRFVKEGKKNGREEQTR